MTLGALERTPRLLFLKNVQNDLKMCKDVVHNILKMCKRKLQIVHRCAKQSKGIVAHFEICYRKSQGNRTHQTGGCGYEDTEN